MRMRCFPADLSLSFSSDSTGSVQTPEEVPEAEGRGRAAGRGVPGSLHSAGIRQVRRHTGQQHNVYTSLLFVPFSGALFSSFITFWIKSSTFFCIVCHNFSLCTYSNYLSKIWNCYYNIIVSFITLSESLILIISLSDLVKNICKMILVLKKPHSSLFIYRLLF